MPQRDAMNDYVEATDRVTSILIRLGAGETVESDEIEDARRQELVATSRYIGSLVKLGASAVAEALSDGGASESDN
jgi:hypothetical protein